MLERKGALLAVAFGLAALVACTANTAVSLPQSESLENVYSGDELPNAQPRALLQLSASSDTAVVTQVGSFQELIKAINDGFSDIEITEHMDATTFGLITEPINGVPFSHQLPPQTSRTRTIRAVLPLAQGQVWLDSVFFRFAQARIGEAIVAASPPAPLHVHSGEAYITNVTIQGDGASDIAGLWVFPSANVLMIDSIIANSKLRVKTPEQAEAQPNGYRRLQQAPATAVGKAPPVVAVQASPTYFLRTTFQNIDLPDSGHVILGDIATNILLQECVFEDVSATRPLGSLDRAAFYSDNQTVLVGDNAGGAADPSTPLAFSRSMGLLPAHLSQWDDFFLDAMKAVQGPGVQRVLYADAVAAGVGVGEDRSTPTTPVADNASAGGAPSPSAQEDNDDGGGSSGAVIGGLIAAAIILVGVVAGLLWYCNKKQRTAEKKKQQLQGLATEPSQFPGHVPSHHYGGNGLAPQGAPVWGPPQPDGKPGYAVSATPSYDRTNVSNASSGAGTHRSMEAHAYAMHPMYSGAAPQYGLQPAHGSTPSLSAMSGVGTHPNASSFVSHPFPQATMTNTTFDDITYPTASSGAGTRTGAAGEPVGPLQEGASVDDKIERLHKQLDGMHAVKKPILGSYEVLSHANRRQGGQGVVQFSRGVSDQLDYAVKFFVSKKAFDEEGEFYKNSPLGALLPKCLVLCANENGEVTDAHGIPLPSFLIMEKGESLDEWNRRAKPDNFQAVAMLANIAKRLSHMHEAGFVHRDLKPGNVMWLPRENRWTIIDFGCVAQVGAPASICYSLRYTAPEVIKALDRQEKQMIPEPAMDSWALGVMAYELLSGGPAFQVLVDGRDQIVSQLKGEAELPWEGSRANPELMRKLRTLRRPIMSLLDRDPSNRPSMTKFCDMCDDIFGTRTLKG